MHTEPRKRGAERNTQRRLLHLWEESEEAGALLKLPPRGFPSSVSTAIVQPVIAELNTDPWGFAENDTS